MLHARRDLGPSPTSCSFVSLCGPGEAKLPPCHRTVRTYLVCGCFRRTRKMIVSVLPAADGDIAFHRRSAVSAPAPLAGICPALFAPYLPRLRCGDSRTRPTTAPWPGESLCKNTYGLLNNRPDGSQTLWTGRSGAEGKASSW
ncbi:hypothetical protein DAEQUDRAFT_601570 [Daedalea quercina L-15889]|uniref:Uncharacterized protein n=1 Tax=Daedalea quercina L-15889 TaxID=1314783 RepID=A0A165LMP2_9APHY|nr:hypothetical protein DAEQUDRAFT_601570 [Daedalea quercina L-15889]